MVIFLSLRFPQGKLISLCPKDTPGELCCQKPRTPMSSRTPCSWTNTSVSVSLPFPRSSNSRRTKRPRSRCSVRPPVRPLARLFAVRSLPAIRAVTRTASPAVFGGSYARPPAYAESLPSHSRATTAGRRFSPDRSPSLSANKICF